jgi:hypothetical protein
VHSTNGQARDALASLTRGASALLAWLAGGRCINLA